MRTLALDQTSHHTFAWNSDPYSYKNVHISRKTKLHITLSLETRPLSFKNRVSRMSLLIETYKSFKEKFQGNSWNSRAAGSLAPSYTVQKHISQADLRANYRRKNVKLPCRQQIYIFNYIYMPSSLLPELGVRFSLVLGRPPAAIRGKNCRWCLRDNFYCYR